jgi:nicotinate-nucleotide pyrophosphorylase (carboxylating)
MSRLYLTELVRRALAEDIGTGDVTTKLIVSPTHSSTAQILAREKLVLAGTDAAIIAFRQLDPDIRFKLNNTDGATIEPDEEIAVVSGETTAILSAERVAVSFLQRMSGIATLTRRFVEKVEGLPVLIADTRKTTPGLRVLEKKAVRTGGGVNHRVGLYDGILIKENHLAALGGDDVIKRAVERARQEAHHLIKVGIEVSSAEEAQTAARAGAEVIMLDNMAVEEMKDAVGLIRNVSKNATIEASGCVCLENVREIAETGVDIISVGKLTHSAPAMDISLEMAANANAD